MAKDNVKAKTAKEKPKRRIGTPPKYQQIFDRMARRLCLNGATDVELADYFEVTPKTINQWQKEHPSFGEAVRAGRIEDVLDVVESVYASSKDRTVLEQQAIKIREQSESGVFEDKVIVVTVQKFIPADPRAQQFLLRNRQSTKWNEIKPIEAGDGETRPVVELPGGIRIEL